ncbi:hypothetical protein DXG03_002033 [Asterophora parasitica]|uniref:N-acetyltransferase domain-containing protein n=1 Tax=Asterophora parasitica TaxID=117018 RepID=A0A9P7KCH2_9AGAR|nr:hypothetical protein DXG03_002033 [Asterophora parasitica]
MSLKASHAGVATTSDIRVRCFRRQDSDEVRDLFWLAMAIGPGSPRRIALDAALVKPAAKAAYTLILLGLSATFMAQSRATKHFGAILSLSVAVIFLGYRYLLSRSFTDLFKRWLTEDLADISSYYHMHPAGDGTEDFVASGPRGFWVVESDLPDKSGTEIVGIIALGEI